jgi:hypothetical protein
MDGWMGWGGPRSAAGSGGAYSVEDLAPDHVVFSTRPRRQLFPYPCMRAPGQTPVNPPSLPLSL